jgi:hypothetical protein
MGHDQRAKKCRGWHSPRLTFQFLRQAGGSHNPQKWGVHDLRMIEDLKFAVEVFDEGGNKKRGASAIA